MVLIEKLDFAYPKKPRLFEGLDLELERGKVVGLLGKNGAGKSTLMRLMAGLLRPSQGKLLCEGENTFDRQFQFLDQLIFIPEKVGIPDQLKVEEYVQIYRDFYSGFDQNRMQSLLSDFQIEVGDRISNLSYGQQKKLQIAIGLSAGAKLLLFDEPTNGLDIPSKSAFRKVISANLQEDQLLVISTHQVKDIEHLIDQVVILDEGKIKLQADLEVLEETFVFCQGASVPANAIYMEAHLLGSRYIALADGEASGGSPDLEMLFQAVIEGKLEGKFLSNLNNVTL
jgi:ABC-2 type transport system ATP-binding protein